MRMKTFFSVALMCAVAVPASAVTVDKIVFQIDDLAVQSNYDAALGQLVWSQGGVAILHHAAGTDRYRVTVNGLWDDVTDMSVGETAAAVFDTGSFNVTFFALADSTKSTPIGNLSGSLFSGANYYFESETADNPSELYGAALIKLDSWMLTGFQWAENLGDPGGLTASTSNLVQWDIDNYQFNWRSNNTIVTILADESGIPEPATICMLGLGAVAALRRNRRL